MRQCSMAAAPEKQVFAKRHKGGAPSIRRRPDVAISGCVPEPIPLYKLAPVWIQAALHIAAHSWVAAGQEVNLLIGVGSELQLVCSCGRRCVQQIYRHLPRTQFWGSRKVSGRGSYPPAGSSSLRDGLQQTTCNSWPQPGISQCHSICSRCRVFLPEPRQALIMPAAHKQ